MKVMKIHLLACFVILVTGLSSAQAQFWKKKDSSKWSKEECRQLLIDSPWISEDMIGLPYRPPEWPDYVWQGPQLTYTATVRSAWVIRKAALISLGAEWPESRDSVVIHISYYGAEGYRDKATEFWKARTPDELIGLVALITDGKRIPPRSVELDSGSSMTFKGRTYFIPGFTIVFPRTAEGKPLLTPDMKKVYLEIADPNMRMRLPFNVEAMVVNGQVVY